MASAFSNAIQFLGVLGVYDVVLPFLLTFTISYAVLEKTKVLGMFKEGDKSYPQRNLNSLVAFCMGFFVVASSQIVGIINQVAGQVIVLLFISIFYLMLIGSFYKNGEDVFLEGGWRRGFMVAMLVGIILIFANAIRFSDGQSVLDWLYDQLMNNFDSAAVSSIVLVIIILVLIFYITSDKKDEKSSKGGDKA